MRILTWNIRRINASAFGPSFNAILRHSADVVALTEYQSALDGIAIQSFKNAGYPFVVTSSPAPRHNGLLVAAKSDAFVLREAEIEQDQQRWLSIRSVRDDLNILALHIPGSDDDKWTEGDVIRGRDRKDRFWRAVIAYAAEHATERTIIAGDLNTGLPEDSQGQPFVLWKYMHELGSLGYVDTWRSQHEAEMDFTWYSQRKRDGVTVDFNGFRLDYVFVSGPLAPTIESAHHSHEERRTKLSDHSVVVTDLRLG